MESSRSQQESVGALSFNLRSLRLLRAQSQSELAEAVGLTRNHFQLLETGKAASGDIANPRLSTLTAVADAVGVPAPELITPRAIHSVWRWVTGPSGSLDHDLTTRLFDVLMDSSVAATEGNSPGASVSVEDYPSVVLGMTILASGPTTARLLSQPLFEAAVSVSGAAGWVLDPDLIEVRLGHTELAGHL